jgi:ACR3 family arsenite transporter
MSVQCEVSVKQTTGRPMSVFERWLTLWVALCILAGIGLGRWLPAPFQLLGPLEVAQVNLPVGLLLWVMIIPMLMKVNFSALQQVRAHWKGIGVTLFVNWAVKPFSMVLLAAAPCTAMVFVWSRLTGGDPYFTLSQVALNDTIMVFAFAPIVGLLLGLSSIVVPWDTLLTSVTLYLVIPVILAQTWRRQLLRQGQARLEATLDTLGHASILALLATLVLLFAFQGEAILAEPLVILLLAVPILVQVFFNAALATVVGVLIEVPVMLLVVRAVNHTKGWYQHGGAVPVRV